MTKLDSHHVSTIVEMCVTALSNNRERDTGYIEWTDSILRVRINLIDLQCTSLSVLAGCAQLFPAHTETAFQYGLKILRSYTFLGSGTSAGVAVTRESALSLPELRAAAQIVRDLSDVIKSSPTAKKRLLRVLAQFLSRSLVHTHCLNHLFINPGAATSTTPTTFTNPTPLQIPSPELLDFSTTALSVISIDLKATNEISDSISMRFLQTVFEYCNTDNLHLHGITPHSPGCTLPVSEEGNGNGTGTAKFVASGDALLRPLSAASQFSQVGDESFREDAKGMRNTNSTVVVNRSDVIVVIIL